MSRIIEHMKAVMAAELKRCEQEYPLRDGEHETTAATRAALHQRAAAFKARQQQPRSNAGKSHAR